MTPQTFIAKWGPDGPAFYLNEEQGAQSHFIDLCDLLGVPKPGSDAVAVLNPRFEISGDTVVLETLATGSFEPVELRRPVANLRSDADAIWSAIDYALHGY